VTSAHVELVDLVTGASTGTLPLPGQGQGIDVNASRTHVYAAAGGSVVEISTATDTISRTLTLAGSTARKIAVTGGRAYVTHWGTGGSTVDRLDLVTGTVDVLSIPGSAWEITASLTGNALWIGHIGLGDMVTRVETSGFTIDTSTSVTNNPIAIEQNPLGGEIYVAARDDLSGVTTSDLHALDPTTLSHIRSYAVDDAFGIAVTPDGLWLYACSNNQTGPPAPPYYLSKVDLVAHAVVATTIGPLGEQPWYLAMDPAGAFVYTCDNASNQISEVDTATDTVTRTIPLTGDPRDAVAW
jgi:YVTN family beta-propeller protein